ncbi:MAG: hypothetical protein WBY53_06805 [Acidobacteriaceae bacterium]
MDGHLDRKHELILESLLAGGLPRSLRWDDVVDVIGKVGTIEPHGDDRFEFAVGSQRAFFKRPSSHTLETSEAARLRRLLRDSEFMRAPDKAVPIMRMAVVIDHHLARIFRNGDAIRQHSEASVRPYDPHGFHHHLIHRKEAHYLGERTPEESSYYDEIASDLSSAEEIVLIGHGIGKSSALEVLKEYLKKHHSTIY